MPAKTKRSKNYLFALTALILYAIPSSIGPASAKNHNSEKTSGADELMIRKQARDYAAAFAAADSKTLAEMWSPSGTFVNGNGQEYRGRAAIQEMFDKLFKQIGKQPLAITVSSIRFPAPAVAIEEGTSQFVSPSSPQAIDKYTVTHVKHNGSWLMEAVLETGDNTADSRAPENRLPRLNWMLGNWTAGNTHLHVDWLPNHNKTFLRCNFSADSSSASSAQNDDLQILGWNPRTSHVNVWHYGANGGFGYGRMINTDPQTWIERASSMEPDGTIYSADYTFKKLDDNTYTWQSTNRCRGRTSLPDLPAVTVKRDGTAN